MESSIFRKHFGIDFNNFWYDFRSLFGIFTCGVVDFSDAFWRRFRYFFTRFSIPFRFDTFLIRFSTPFRHLYIWSRRFFGCIFASISTHFFDMSLDSFSALLHLESSIFRKYFGIDFNTFWYDFQNVRTSQLAYSADATSLKHQKRKPFSSLPLPNAQTCQFHTRQS